MRAFIEKPSEHSENKIIVKLCSTLCPRDSVEGGDFYTFHFGRVATNTKHAVIVVLGCAKIVLWLSMEAFHLAAWADCQTTASLVGETIDNGDTAGLIVFVTAGAD